MVSTALEAGEFPLKPMSHGVITHISTHHEKTTDNRDEIVLAKFGKAQQLKVDSKRPCEASQAFG